MLGFDGVVSQEVAQGNKSVIVNNPKTSLSFSRCFVAHNFYRHCWKHH